VHMYALATIYEVKIPLRKWKKSLLQRNPAQMTSAIKLIVVNLKQPIWPSSRVWTVLFPYS
jgi:hypothetical protein